jgi:hypothetical protein
VRTATPTRKPQDDTRRSGRRSSAGIHSGRSAAIGPHHADQRMHRFEEQQHGEVDRNDDQQAADQRAP